MRRVASLLLLVMVFWWGSADDPLEPSGSEGPSLFPTLPAPALTAPENGVVLSSSAASTALYEPPDGYSYFGFTMRDWDNLNTSSSDATVDNAQWGDTRLFAERLQDSIRIELGGKVPTVLAVPTVWQLDSGELLPFSTGVLRRVQRFHQYGNQQIVPSVLWNVQTGWGTGDKPDYHGITVVDVASGSLDGYIRQYARDVKAYGQPLFIRLLCGEFNGSWWRFCSPRANPALTIQDFIDAWRRVVGIFREEKVGNVAWVWTPNTCPPPPQEWNCDRNLESYWPGDDYVDWAGIDHYDFGPPSWMDPFYQFAVEHTKPFFLAEFGVRIDSSRLTPTQQQQWLNDMFDYFEAHPKIKAIVYFNYNGNPEDEAHMANHVWLYDGQVNYHPNVNNKDYRLIAESGADFRGTFARRIAHPRYISGIVGPSTAPAQGASGCYYTTPEPTLLDSPPNCSALTSFTTTLQWRNWPAGSTQYELQVIPFGFDGPALDLIRNVDGATGSFTLTAPPASYFLLPDMKYIWMVRTNSLPTFVGPGDLRWKGWSQAWTFRTPVRDSNRITLVSPANEATVGYAEPQVLQWANGDKDVFYYEVQVSADPGFETDPAKASAAVWWNLVHGGMTNPSNSWQTPALEPGATYYWRVRPRVQGDGAPVAWGPTWSFTVKRPPRLYLTDARVAELRRDIQGSHSALRQRMKANTDWLLRSSPPQAPETLPSEDMLNQWRGFGNRIPWYALAYRLTGDPKYLSKAREWMLAVSGYPVWWDDDLATSHVLYGFAVGYDWLYNELTSEERRVIREALRSNAAKKHLQATSNIWWSRHQYLNNHNYINACALMAVGVALEGEVPEAKDWISWAKQDMDNVLAVLADDGASIEGIPYWGYGLEYLLKYLDIARDKLGQDGYANTWVRNTAAYRLYATLPDYKSTVDFGDAPRFDWYGPNYLLRKLAREYRDGYAQWLARIVDEARGNPSGQTSWLDLLWYDPTVPEVDPAGLPLARHFDDLGLWFSRSGWQRGGTYLAFKSGPYQGYKAMSMYGKDLGAGHVQPDSGTFLLFSGNRFLVADLGYTSSKLTKDENTLLVNGRGQLGEGGPWFKPNQRLNEKYAFIETTSSSGRFDHVVGQIADVYPEDVGLEQFRREILFVKPSVVVVRDSVRTREPSTFTFSFHTEGAVEGSGNRRLITYGTEALEFLTHGTNATTRIEQRVLSDSERHGSYNQRETRVIVVENVEQRNSQEFVHVFGLRKADEQMSIDCAQSGPFDCTVSYLGETTRIWLDDNATIRVVVEAGGTREERAFP